MTTAQELRRQQHEADLRELLSLPAGRRFIWWAIDEHAGVCRASYAGTDTHATAYHEGRRALGVDLMLECQRLAPDDYMRMWNEAISRQRAEALEAEREREKADAE